MAGTTTVAQIKALREMVKSEFEVPVCKKCYDKGTCQHITTASSWDKKGVLAQAEDVGDPYTSFYLGAYAMPNMHVHVTLTSAMQECNKKTDEKRKTQRRKQAEFSLLHAHAIMLRVIRSQNDLFSLGLEEDIEACEKDWASVWRHLSG